MDNLKLTLIPFVVLGVLSFALMMAAPIGV